MRILWDNWSQWGLRPSKCWVKIKGHNVWVSTSPGQREFSSVTWIRFSFCNLNFTTFLGVPSFIGFELHQITFLPLLRWFFFLYSVNVVNPTDHFSNANLGIPQITTESWYIFIDYFHNILAKFHYNLTIFWSFVYFPDISACNSLFCNILVKFSFLH